MKKRVKQVSQYNFSSKNRRGQVTLFIIIAVVLVAAVALFFIFRGDVSSDEPYSPEVQGVNNFVQECIDEVGQEVIYKVGQSGGHYFAPDELSTASGIPYYHVKEESYIPSKNQIEDEISFFVKEKLFFCTRNFVSFSGLEIEQDTIKAEAEILDEEVVLELDYPIRISKGEDVSVIEDFEVSIPVRFGVVYNSVSKMIEEDSKGEGICLSCLYELSEEKDLYVELLDYDDETVIFIYRDLDSEINGEVFEYVYANKY